MGLVLVKLVIEVKVDKNVDRDYKNIPRDRLLHQAEEHYSKSKFRQASLIYSYLLKNGGLEIAEWLNLAECFYNLSAFHAALGCYRHAIDFGLIEDEHSDIKLANIQKELGNYDIAQNYALKSINRSRSRSALLNYAEILAEMKNFEKAIEVFEELLERFPEDYQIIYEHRYIKLHLSKDEDNWPERDNAYNRSGNLSHPIEKHVPKWGGECLNGKRLYIMREKRFSDNILMLRYLSKLEKMGAIITLECWLKLKNLFHDIPVENLEVSYEPRGLDYDFCCPLMSLPKLLGVTDLGIPEPYALSPPITSRMVVEENIIIPQDKKLNIGIAWSGDDAYADNRKRSLHLNEFLNLVSRVDNCRFVSLQKGPEAYELRKNNHTTLIRDFSTEVLDFSVTAAMLTKLDLVITIDCSIAHLAGSMGIPTLVLLGYKPFWLYFPEKHTTPWYPSFRLLRKSNAKEWNTVFGEVERIISTLSSSKFKTGCIGSSEILSSVDKTIAEHFN